MCVVLFGVNLVLFHVNDKELMLNNDFSFEFLFILS